MSAASSARVQLMVETAGADKRQNWEDFRAVEKAKLREEQAKIELEEKWRLEHRNTLDKDRVRLLARGTNHKKEKKEKKKKRKKKTKKAKKRKRGKPGGGGTEEDEGGPVRLSAFVQDAGSDSDSSSESGGAGGKKPPGLTAYGGRPNGNRTETDHETGRKTRWAAVEVEPLVPQTSGSTGVPFAMQLRFGGPGLLPLPVGLLGVSSGGMLPLPASAQCLKMRQQMLQQQHMQQQMGMLNQQQMQMQMLLSQRPVPHLLMAMGGLQSGPLVLSPRLQPQLMPPPQLAYQQQLLLQQHHCQAMAQMQAHRALAQLQAHQARPVQAQPEQPQLHAQQAEPRKTRWGPSRAGGAAPHGC